VRLVPAPRGSGLVAGLVPAKLLSMAGISDCYTSSTGHTRTMGNFVKATFFALRSSYRFLTPNLWKENAVTKAPFAQFTDFLKDEAK
jgi:small subunit ribosomal protein S2e